MADEMDLILELEEDLSEEEHDEETVERASDDESGSDISSGDPYHMDIAVDVADCSLGEDGNPEVDKEFLDALTEIEGQNAFPCPHCDKVCKSKGGLTRHHNSKHREESQEAAVDSVSPSASALDLDTVAAFVESIKKAIIEEKLYGEEINNGLKTVSATKALLTAVSPIYNKFCRKKNQDRLLEDFYALIPRSCELLNCPDYRLTNLVMIHLPDRLVGCYNVNRVRDRGEPSVAEVVSIDPAEHGPLSYIAGHVISQLFKKNRGKQNLENEELQALLQNMKSANDSNQYISARTRGGLVTPCDDLVAILEEAELLFRKEVSKSDLVLRNIPTDSICDSALESPKIKSLWDNIVVASGVPSTSSTSKLCLENVIKLYLKVRSFSYARDYVMKYKKKQKELRKHALRKEMKMTADNE